MLKKLGKMTVEQACFSGKTGKADLHMHTTYSDGCATISELLEHVQMHTQLEVIAITDHDQIEGALRARDLWAKRLYRFDFVVGALERPGGDHRVIVRQESTAVSCQSLGHLL